MRFKFSKKSVLLTMLCKFINRKKDVNMQKEMLNFDYYNPTHIIFGKNRFNELNEVIPQDKKVLILYGGGSVERFGTLDKVKAALKSREVG